MTYAYRFTATAQRQLRAISRPDATRIPGRSELYTLRVGSWCRSPGRVRKV